MRPSENDPKHSVATVRFTYNQFSAIRILLSEGSGTRKCRGRRTHRSESPRQEFIFLRIELPKEWSNDTDVSIGKEGAHAEPN